MGNQPRSDIKTSPLPAPELIIPPTTEPKPHQELVKEAWDKVVCPHLHSDDAALLTTLAVRSESVPAEHRFPIERDTDENFHKEPKGLKRIYVVGPDVARFFLHGMSHGETFPNVVRAGVLGFEQNMGNPIVARIENI